MGHLWSLLISSTLEQISPGRFKILQKNSSERRSITWGNCTIVCGNTIGRFAFVGAGAVVTKDIPDFALVVGNPAHIIGWMSEAGKKLYFDENGYANCEKSKKRYKLENGFVRKVE